MMNYSEPHHKQQQSYYFVVQRYLGHGDKAEDRDYLAEILQTWRPEIDEDYHIGWALHWAIFKGDDEAVQMMIDAGVSPTVQQPHDPNFTPLLAASKYGRLQMARLFWRLVGPDGRFFPSRRIKPHQLTCLLLAARNNHADLTAYFLDVWDGWDDNEKRQALVDAAFAWCDDAVAVLLSKVSYESKPIQEALGQAVGRRMILPEYETRPDPTADDFETQEQLVCRLIDAGGDPEGEDRYNYWPLLHRAVLSKDCVGSCRGLLKRGANPNRPGPEGKTALHTMYTCSSRLRPQTTTLEILLQHGALSELADETGETSLHAVANMGSYAQLQLCLSHCGAPDSESIQLRNPHGESLLHYAAAGGQEDDMLGFLLGSDSLDVNVVNDNGWTPLMCALTPTRRKTIRRMCRTAEFLLQHGANAQIVTNEGWTPLHALGAWPVAQDAEGRAEVAQLARKLISSGAPTGTRSSVIRSLSTNAATLSDTWGFRMREFVQAASTSGQGDLGLTFDTTPLMWARRRKATDVEEAIVEHLASVSMVSVVSAS